jgi:hypothetical protein
MIACTVYLEARLRTPGGIASTHGKQLPDITGTDTSDSTSTREQRDLADRAFEWPLLRCGFNRSTQHIGELV